MVKSLNMLYVCHVFPSIWVFLFFLIFDVPQNGSVSESLTHTSGHRLIKSIPMPKNTVFTVSATSNLDPEGGKSLCDATEIRSK